MWKIGKEDDNESKDDVEDASADYDEDVGHLEGDGVEDHNEKNRDENVGAEEESEQRDGSDAVADEKVFMLWAFQQVDFKHRCLCHLSLSLSLLPDSDSIEGDSNNEPPGWETSFLTLVEVNHLWWKVLIGVIDYFYDGDL